PEPGRRVATWPARHRRFHDGGGDLLEVAARDRPVAVAGEDHLALLGDLEASGHGSRRLRADGAVGGAAAPPQGATSPMKQGEPDAVPLDRKSTRLNSSH